MTKQPAVFLDRDGTLIEEVNFLSRVEDLRVFPFTADAVRLLKENGFLVIVVTNQSGIGRGVYDEAAMRSIHDQIQVELSGAIDGFYFCPHLPCDGCDCRKPELGMINAAAAVRAGSLKVENPVLKGDEINFSVALGSIDYKFAGRIQGDRMEGTAIPPVGGKAVAWRALRLPPDKK